MYARTYDTVLNGAHARTYKLLNQIDPLVQRPDDDDIRAVLGDTSVINVATGDVGLADEG
ncbi:MAG: hypothetical protein R3B72_05850 [Polyangiaceae bacterium]